MIVKKFKWSIKELHRFKELVCKEQKLSAPSCEGCTQTKEDIDYCYYEIMSDVAGEQVHMLISHGVK